MNLKLEMKMIYVVKKAILPVLLMMREQKIMVNMMLGNFGKILVLI